MKGTMTKQEMRTQIPFLRELEYHDLLQADRLIDKGADVALLYFWFNLLKGHYRHVQKIIDLNGQVEYYCKRNPEFSQEIRNWYRCYQETYGADYRPQPRARV